ncbi:MAG TPA: HDOD domain-containing protein [Solirubrobacteraceae bacterium]|nr:HDOD domain-containing protein [Solirubrobacteraceae bacterium]
MRDELADNEKHPGHTIDSIVLARQPIFDRRESVVGYALRYRPLTPSGQLDGSETSIASVIVGALAEIGLKKLVGDRPAHIEVTPQFLPYVSQVPLPPERVVLELAATPHADADLLPALHDVIKAGFEIAIVGVIPPGAGEALWQLARAVKLDARAVAGGGDEVNDLLTGLRRRGLRLIVEGVDTHDQYEATRALHFDAYQGQYFAAPRSIREPVAPTHRLGALVSLTHGATEASLEDLERHVCEDPGLSYRFVRLANSALYGGRTPVGSIRQALMRLGAAAVSRWIMLFALSKMTDRPQPLLNTAVHRARLCELLANEYPDTVPDRAFSAGLFSVLDALLGCPMREVIADLCLDDRLAAAITDHRGPEGQLLATVLAYERGDFAASAQGDVRLVNVANAYLHAAGWADYVTAMAA